MGSESPLLRYWLVIQTSCCQGAGFQGPEPCCHSSSSCSIQSLQIRSQRKGQKLKQRQCMEACALRARGGSRGWELAPGGFTQPDGQGSWPCSSTAIPPMRSGYGGGNMAMDGFQMGYQVCPQSTLRLLWSQHLSQL